MKKESERRYLSSGRAEIRIDAPADKPRMLVGYPVVYDVFSEDLGGFIETIKPGAFAESLKTADVRALVDHDPSKLLARQKSKTLRLFDDEISMRAEIDLPDVSYACDLARSVERGDCDGMSFGFFASEDSWDKDKGGRVIRTILKAEIFDVSAVTYPAYAETSLALRSLDSWKKAKGDPDEVRRMRQRLNESCFRIF